MNDNIKIIGGDEISKILKNKENDIVKLIEDAYEFHHSGESELPHSIFLKFPKQPKDRIIGLPAYIGGDINIAGFKWISSFPENIYNGMDRASAMLVLNSMSNGRPIAVLESSIISAKRTAASAALAAKHLSIYTDSDTFAIVGCGFIGYEILRFTLSQVPTLNKIIIYDLSEERAKIFVNKAKKEFDIEIIIAKSLDEIFSFGGLVALCTTAPDPYINETMNINTKSIILNISLRDLSPEVVADSINIVDDFEHVNRSETSIHLATKMYQHNKFCYGNISNLINGEIDSLDTRDKPIVFNPFGLGVLDIILGNFCLVNANEQNIGTEIKSFFPAPWNSVTTLKDINE